MSIRLARFEDARTILNWVNQSDSLSWKLKNNGKIKKIDHEKWLRKTLLNYKSRIWIIEDEKKNNIGQIRIDLIKKLANIDIYVQKEFRSKGYALRSLKEAIKYFSSDFNCVRFLAIVNKKNFVSANLFVKCGIKLKRISKHQWLHYNL